MCAMGVVRFNHTTMALPERANVPVFRETDGRRGQKRNVQNCLPLARWGIVNSTLKRGRGRFGHSVSLLK
jgi:hypothetical protein